MDFHFEIANKKLNAMVEKQAKNIGMDVDELIWAYINRGLMSDNLSEDTFNECHSEKYLCVINDALGVD